MNATSGGASPDPFPSSPTGNNNLFTIYTKIGVASRTEAALLARRSGLGG